MSAAALIAQQQLSEYDSTRPRPWRGWPSANFVSGCLRSFGVCPVRGRVRHQLPCEP